MNHDCAIGPSAADAALMAMPPVWEMAFPTRSPHSVFCVGQFNAHCG